MFFFGRWWRSLIFLTIAVSFLRLQSFLFTAPVRSLVFPLRFFCQRFEGTVRNDCLGSFLPKIPFLPWTFPRAPPLPPVNVLESRGSHSWRFLNIPLNAKRVLCSVPSLLSPQIFSQGCGILRLRNLLSVNATLFSPSASSACPCGSTPPSPCQSAGLGRR